MKNVSPDSTRLAPCEQLAHHAAALLVRIERRVHHDALLHEHHRARLGDHRLARIEGHDHRLQVVADEIVVDLVRSPRASAIPPRSGSAPADRRLAAVRICDRATYDRSTVACSGIDRLRGANLVRDHRAHRSSVSLRRDPTQTASRSPSPRHRVAARRARSRRSHDTTRRHTLTRRLASSTAWRCTRDGSSLVRGDRIVAAGPAATLSVPAGARARRRSPGTTLLPGLIERHSHLLLHPYNETTLERPGAARAARAADRARDEPRARDAARRLHHRARSRHRGRRLRRRRTQARDRAGDHPGAAHDRRDARDRRDRAATGRAASRRRWTCRRAPRRRTVDTLARVVRDQIGRGADWIKVYADYRWGPNGEARPTFTLDELKLIVEIATSVRAARRGARVNRGRDAPRDARRRRDDRARRRRARRRCSG